MSIPVFRKTKECQGLLDEEDIEKKPNDEPEPEEPGEAGNDLPPEGYEGDPPFPSDDAEHALPLVEE